MDRRKLKDIQEISEMETIPNKTRFPWSNEMSFISLLPCNKGFTACTSDFVDGSETRL